MSSWEVATAPGVPIVLIIYTHIMLLTAAWTPGRWSPPGQPDVYLQIVVYWLCEFSNSGILFHTSPPWWTRILSTAYINLYRVNWALTGGLVHCSLSTTAKENWECRIAKGLLGMLAFFVCVRSSLQYALEKRLEDCICEYSCAMISRKFE